MARNDNDVKFNFERDLRGIDQPFRFLFVDAVKRELQREYTFNGLNDKGEPLQEDSTTKDGRGELGRPVYGELKIEGGSYEDPDGNTINYAGGPNNLNDKTVKGLEIDTVILVVNQTKNIVKTQISGRNGTIKEYINDGDYEVQISGILSSGINNVEPTEQIETLVDICQARDSLKVSNDFLGRLGVTELVIESYSFPQREGFRDNFFFQINAVSNKPFELRIKEDI